MQNYRHKTKRPHIPTEQRSGLVKNEDRAPVPYVPPLRSKEGPMLSWDRDPELETKATPATPLYIHEKIHPGAFADSLAKHASEQQHSLFADFNGIDENARFEWYKHEANWSNRLIRGESCHIMASLIEKEGFSGKVQMIYFDPPYGINFKGNMQAKADDRRTDGVGKKSHIPNEPTVIKAFRDTYKNGIHSYLDNIYRITAYARELLCEEGSIFLQIGKENVHKLSLVLDETFGSENRVETITIRTGGESSSNVLSGVATYLLWYAKDKSKVKYRQLYIPLNRKEIIEHMGSYALVEDSNGNRRNVTSQMRQDPAQYISENERLCRRRGLYSSGWQEGRSMPYTFKGVEYECGPDSHWSINKEGLDRLAEKGRLSAASAESTLGWILYEDEIPGKKINNIWSQRMYANEMHYVVQTAESILKRCILMATDPGDLVFDPTCGSGTTAYVAEQWGRRWVTSDASKVAISLARQRLITGIYPYYLLQDSLEGTTKERELQASVNMQIDTSHKNNEYGHDPAKGFVYKRVPKVSAAILGYDQVAPPIFLVDQPLQKRGITRISSPFTVESHSPYRVLRPEDILESEFDENVRTSIIDALQISGIDLRSDNQRLNVQEIEPYPQSPLTHIAETDKGKAAIMIAPDDCTLPPDIINLAIEKAQVIPSVNLLIVIAFAFEADSRSKHSFAAGRLEVYKAQANQDLKIENAMDHKRHDAFVLIGEPSVKLEEATNDEITVKVEGYDTYNPATGQIEPGVGKDVQCWMIDTNYDGNSFFARRIHFPGGKMNEQISRYARELEAYIDQKIWPSVFALESAPFPKPKTGRIAVRIITNTHTEMTTVVNVD